MRIFYCRMVDAQTNHLTDPMFDLRTRLSGCKPFGLALCWLCMWQASAQGDVNLEDGVVAQNMEAVAFIPVSDMLTNKLNDIASWHDDVMDESYLLVGCENGTAFFKMLPGARPIYMGKWPTAKREQHCGETSKSSTTTPTWSAKRRPMACRCSLKRFEIGRLWTVPRIGARRCGFGTVIRPQCGGLRRKEPSHSSGLVMDGRWGCHF